MKPLLVAILVLAGVAQITPRTGASEKPAAPQRSPEPPPLRATPGFGIQVKDGVISVSPEVAQQMFAAGSIDFPSIAGNSCADRMFQMPGARAGDTLAASWPPTLDRDLLGMAFVGVADTVVVRLCNVAPKAVDPPSGPFAVRVVRGY